MTAHLKNKSAAVKPTKVHSGSPQPQRAEKRSPTRASPTRAVSSTSLRKSARLHLTETNKISLPTSKMQNSSLFDASHMPDDDSEIDETSSLLPTTQSLTTPHHAQTEENIQVSTAFHAVQTVEEDAELMQLGLVSHTAVILDDLRGDYWNILVLTLLYILQGLPIGLSMTIPLVMQERHVGFSAQAVFSLVSLPFSCKLLWAPLVDSFYSTSFGRRKSWAVPTQLLCGLLLFFFASNVDSWIGKIPSSVSSLDATTIPSAAIPHVNVFALSTFFIVAYFFMATQDIAVDAWALSMLRTRNIVWAGTINNIGQYIGIYLTYISYLFLSSSSFCAQWLSFLLPVDPSTGNIQQDATLLDIVTLMQICGLLFIFTTLCIAFFQPETEHHALDVISFNFWHLQERKRLLGLLTPNQSLTISIPSKQEFERLLQSAAAASFSSTDDDDDGLTVTDVLAPSAIAPSPNDDQNPVIELSSLSTESLPKPTLTSRPSVVPTVFPTRSLFNLPNDQPITAYASLLQLSQSLQSVSPSTLSIISHERRYMAASHADGSSSEEEEDMSLSTTIAHMRAVLSLSNVRWLVFWLLTHRISVAASESLTQLKLLDRGLKKEQIAYITSLFAPITFIVPILLTSLMARTKAPFTFSVLSLLPRIFQSVCWMIFVAIFPILIYNDQHTTMMYVILCILTFLQQLCGLVQTVCGMSFFAMVVDPKIAGTFITMLHTAANLGGMLTRLFSMYVVDILTVKACLSPQLVTASSINTSNNDHVNDNVVGVGVDDVLLKSRVSHQRTDDAFSINSIPMDQLIEQQLLQTFTQTVNVPITLSQFQNEVKRVGGPDLVEKQLSNAIVHNSNQGNDNVSPSVKITDSTDPINTPQNEPQIDFSRLLPTSFSPSSDSPISLLYDLHISSFDQFLYTSTEWLSLSMQSFLSFCGVSDTIMDVLFNPIFRHQYFNSLASPEQQQQQSTLPSNRVPQLGKPIVSKPERPVTTQPTSSLLYSCTPLVDTYRASALIEAQNSPQLDQSPANFISAMQFVTANAINSPIAAVQSPTNFCEAIGGTCEPIIDGYFLQVAVQAAIGIVYLACFWPILRTFDTLPITAWHSKTTGTPSK